MKPEEFRAWRRSLGLKQKDAAERLGLKKRVIQYYEKGHRDGKRVDVPRTVELACLALSLGCERYDGRPLPRSASDLPTLQASSRTARPED
nr:helix-turn-helix transcriptional regulator [Consotaella salsifontis]